MSSGSKIAVIGCGYVGLVTGICFAELGNQVTCIDIDKDKVAALSKGTLPICEAGLQEILKRNLVNEQLSFTSDYSKAVKESEVIFVAVGTPSSPIKGADLSQVEEAIEDVLLLDFDDEKIVAMKSTVPVGTGERFTNLFKRKRRNLSYVSNPEFLREGSAVDDFLNPHRIVIGSVNPGASQRVANLHQPFQAPIIFTSTSSAEMIKYASNAFLATKISFINEIANLCDHVDADVKVVAEGMSLDPRIGPHFLGAGIGYGGFCFPKDILALKQLAGNSGYHFQLLSAVIEVNEMQKTLVIRKLKKYLGDLEDKVIAVLGLSFKPGTDDVRQSVAIDLIHLLQFEGADVKAFDPLAVSNAKRILKDVEFSKDAYDAATKADALVIATEDPAHQELDWTKIVGLMQTPLIIDGRNLLSGEQMPENVTLEQIGRPPRISDQVSWLQKKQVLEKYNSKINERANDQIDADFSR